MDAQLLKVPLEQLNKNFRLRQKQASPISDVAPIALASL